MTTETPKADSPEAIWLSPICDLDAHHGEGRTWASPAPVAECEDCGHPWVKYVRSDLSTRPEAQSLPTVSGEQLPPFADAWAKYEAKGYRYGGDALENVAFGYRIAGEELAALSPPVSEADGLADELDRLARKATAEPWAVDTLKSEGEYGSGPDTSIGFEVSAIYDDNGLALFDALNSDAITVQEDYPDEDGYVLAYDEVSAANAALIVALRNNLPRILTALRAQPDRPADRGDAEPEAWLIREIRGSKITVMSGQMFKRKDAAEAAALRLTNDWRLCIAFPVAALSRQPVEAERGSEAEGWRRTLERTLETASKAPAGWRIKLLSEGIREALNPSDGDPQ